MEPITLGAIYIGAHAAAAIGGSYKNRQEWRGKWRTLQSGMSPAKVVAAIGAPKNIQVDSGVTLYKYSMGGRAMFLADELTSWTEPKM